MNSTDRTSLLHLMETGIMTETKFNKTRQMELTSWVFATANSCAKIIEPLLSRFLILKIPEYTVEEFIYLVTLTTKFTIISLWHPFGSLYIPHQDRFPPF